MNRHERRAAKSRGGEQPESGGKILVRSGEMPPDIPTDVHELLQMHRDRVKAGFTGQCRLAVTTFGDENTTSAIPVDFDDNDLPCIIAALKDIVAHADADRYVFLADGTMKHANEDILMVGAVSADGEKAMGCFTIEHDDAGNAALGEWEGGVEGEGWPVELFGPPRPVHRETVH